VRERLDVERERPRQFSYNCRGRRSPRQDQPRLHFVDPHYRPLTLQFFRATVR
jgi:hypothetical protein